MSEELRACPFCGKQPSIVVPDDSYGAAYICCGDINECPVNPRSEAELTAGETLADAALRWNTRTPTEPGEAEVERVARAIDDALPESDDFTLAPSQIKRAARAAIAALRSTAPASDVAEAENYASEFVKGEAPADVSRAAVDDDALVERAELRKIIAELGYCTADASLEFMRLIPGEVAANLQSLQASIRVKDEALRDLLDGSERIARYHGIDIDAECAAYQDSPFAKARAALSQPIGGE